MGLLAIAWFINRHKPKPQAEMPEIDRAVVDKYRETIEKDLANLD